VCLDEVMKMNRKQRRALANQQNAQLSTGPRTAEGKAVSSQNAVRHGLVGGSPVLAHEDKGAYERLWAAMRSEWAPAGEHQNFLLSQMVDARWRLERIQRLETAYFDLCVDPAAEGSGEHAIVRSMLNRKGDPLALFRRHESALERTYHRCVKELREAQERAAEEERAATKVEDRARKADEVRLRAAQEQALHEFIFAPPPGFRPIPEPSVTAEAELLMEG
jgi:hypothetical protein